MSKDAITAEDVANALALTDVCRRDGRPLELDWPGLRAAVAGWTDRERAEAYHWAVETHVRACGHGGAIKGPPHVEKLRRPGRRPAAPDPVVLGFWPEVVLDLAFGAAVVAYAAAVLGVGVVLFRKITGI